MRQNSTLKDKLNTRLTQILLKLNEAQRFTIDELAEEFNVSIRTIQRDINERFSYLPLKKENGYIFLDQYYLGKLSHNDIKNFAIFSGIKDLYPNLDNNFINSILSKKFDDIYLIKYIPYESSKKLTKEFQDIQIAINNNYTLLFKYNDKKRELKPYKLVNNNGIWYLVGDDNSKLKTFTINKIKNMQLTNEEFTINNEFKTIIEQNQDTWFSQDKIDVILQIDISVALYFKRRDLLPNQKILEENDKYLLLSTTVSYDDEILRVVRSWIPHIKIIKPLYLNDKLYKELKEFIKLK